MKNNELYPIGTVMKIGDDNDEVVIISHMIERKNGRTSQYGAVRYPQGIIDNDFIYFNEDRINEVLKIGYQEDEQSIAIETTTKNNYYPVGTIVKLRESNELIMISQRNVTSRDRFKHYSGISFPKGYVDGEELTFFDDEEIAEVLFSGYESDEDRELVKTIKDKTVIGGYDSETPMFKNSKIGVPIYSKKIVKEDFEAESYRRGKVFALLFSLLFVLTVIRSCMR